MSTSSSFSRRLALHPLTFLVEDDGVVVGRVETDTYAVLPHDGAALLRRLGVEAVDEASLWYERTYGEPVDIDGFVRTLAELGFLADPEAAAHPSAAAADSAAPSGVAGARSLRWERLGRAVFSPAAWVIYAAIVAASVAACVADPHLIPHRDHVFFSSYLVLVEVTVAAGQLPLILVHEVFHVLAARRVGVNARIRVGQRLYFVVFETVMDGLVIVPRARRYLPMLAGMVADLLLVALLTIAAWVMTTSARGQSVVSGVFLALAFTTVVRFCLEFLLFLRTDVYYLISTVCGCVDLHGTSGERIRNSWWRLVRRPERASDPGRWHPRDAAAVRWYTPLHLAGYGLALGLLVTTLLPITWRFLSTAVALLIRPDVASPHFWDAAGLLLLNLAQPALALLLRLRDSGALPNPLRRKGMS
jgi:hypothetical protein